MGYTHYWRRPQAIPEAQYSRIASDFRELVPYLREAGVKLAGGFGEGEPQIDDKEVWFNGDQHCGHAEADLGITWPASGARGVSVSATTTPRPAGTWFAGATLASRTCGGDCSHETLHFPKMLELEKWDKPENDRYFQFCKTAFKPYDLAVTAFLIIAKHYMGPALLVSSDGDDDEWADAVRLCEAILGYGGEFELDKDE